MTTIPTTSTPSITAITAFEPRFPESQAITFRRIEDSTELQTDTRRGYYELEYENIMHNALNNICLLELLSLLKQPKWNICVAKCRSTTKFATEDCLSLTRQTRLLCTYHK